MLKVSFEAKSYWKKEFPFHTFPTFQFTHNLPNVNEENLAFWKPWAFESHSEVRMRPIFDKIFSHFDLNLYIIVINFFMIQENPGKTMGGTGSVLLKTVCCFFLFQVICTVGMTIEVSASDKILNVMLRLVFIF